MLRAQTLPVTSSFNGYEDYVIVYRHEGETVRLLIDTFVASLGLPLSSYGGNGPADFDSLARFDEIGALAASELMLTGVTDPILYIVNETCGISLSPDGGLRFAISGSTLWKIENDGALTLTSEDVKSSWRDELGLGSLALQSAAAVAITGGTISNPTVFNANITGTTAFEDELQVRESLGLLGGGLDSLVLSEVSVTAATTLTSGAFGRWHVCSSTSANYTIALPSVTGNAGKFIGFRVTAASTKLVVLDGNGSQVIDGALTWPMWAQENLILFCDGTSWTKRAMRSQAFHCVKGINATETFIGGLETVHLNTVVTDVSGQMTGAGSNNAVLIPRTGLYRVWAVMALNSDMSAFQNRIHKNGSFLYNIAAPAVLSVSGYAALTAAMTLPLVAGDYLEQYLYSGAGGGLYGDANANSTCISVTELV